MSRAGLRRALVVASLLVLVGAGAWAWAASRLPLAYSVDTMGYVDLGHGPGPAPEGHAMAGEHTPAGLATSVEDLTVPDGPADVRFDLTARQDTSAGVDGSGTTFSLNGQTPGPTLTVRQGDLVEVKLSNQNIADGTTLHWHGIDVPNAADGVAGVTQDAVPPGGSHTYRFVADAAGTYWYHSHQVSHPQVAGGLFGVIVVLPRDGLGDVLDFPLAIHTFRGIRTLNGQQGETVRADAAARTVRVRLVNTDSGPLPAWVSGADYRLVAIDGTEVHEPTMITDRAILITAGGRADLEVSVPAAGAVRVQVAGASLVLGNGPAPTAAAPTRFVDPLGYGTASETGLDTASIDRDFTYAIGRRFGLLDGTPGWWWTINDHLFPDVPMFHVREGDVVRFRISNSSGEVHPMHLHGHHVLVIARDDVAATGSPWWVDSLNVGPGETYDVLMRADNPGIWMDHCHNLPHAAEGLVAHLSYEGVTTPYVVGGSHRNRPEG